MDFETDEIINKKENYLKTAIFVDYENVNRRLQDYDIDPIKDLDLFNKLIQDFNEKKFNIIRSTVYANFNNTREQTEIQYYGFETKHSSIDSKNSSDIEMVVDILNLVYTSNDIDLYVIVSSDRDFIPVIKTLKALDKTVFVISTKSGFNKIVKLYADHHEFIEDIFDVVIEDNQIPKTVDINGIDAELKLKARYVSEQFYNSRFWGDYDKRNGSPVSLKGYISFLQKGLLKTDTEHNIVTYFNVANELGYVRIEFDEIEQKDFVYEGVNRKEIENIDEEKDKIALAKE